MNKKLDHLFKNKLHEQQMAPPPAAWNKVQQQLNNKKQEKSFIYYKIASVCLLILISAITFKLFNKDGGQIINVDKEVAVQNTKPQEKESDKLIENSLNADDSKEPVIGIEDKELNQPLQQLADNKINNKEKEILKKREKINNRIQGEESIVEEFEPEIDTDSEILIVKNKPEPIDVLKENQEFPGITITYKKGNSVKNETVNEKTTELAAIDKDNISVKKLIKFAKDLKVSEINLADIRDSKEDLFSMEIIKLKN